ncbi:MAG TPA: branched-chain amino acid ABC transporter substrate-binding protein [Firmicutes bacterium]|nr:branched-chain amino acid ABC transporter substrate-binding protein [Bacillota bacterium]
MAEHTKRRPKTRARLRAMALVLALAGIALALVASGCGGPKTGSGGDTPGGFKGTVRIGAAGPYTGDLSKIGLDSLNAIRMAVEEANQAGGIDGYKIEVVMGDDAGDAAQATLVAQKFTADPSIVGVIGPMNSNAVNAALPIYDKAGLVIISQSATNPSLTEQGCKVMFRVCPRDDAQGPAAARFIVEELKAKKVYMIDDKGTYGQGLADQVDSALQKLGVTVTRGQIAPGDRDFSAILTRVAAADPDLVYLALPNPSQAASLVSQARGAKMDYQFMGGDGLKEKDQLIKGSQGAAEGFYVTAIGKDVREVPEAADFVKAFEAKYGAMSIFSGQSYEATKILIEAMRKAGVQDGKMDRAKVLANVAATRDYRGILGFPVGFDAKGDVTGGSIYVLQVKGPDFVEVKAYPIGG